MNPSEPPAGNVADGPPATGPLMGATAPPALHVMSWNIRRRVSHLLPRAADRWDVRAPRLRALLQAERPTLLGVQEALADQAHFVRASLGAGYRFVGQGRGARGNGESCPLFYDERRLELLAWDQAALSDQPTRPGSTSWGNVIPRIAVCATFRDRATDKRFQAINTHFDHLSGRSRLLSALAVGRMAAASTLPTVVTGDLNAGEGSPPLLRLLSERQLVDVWDAAHSHASVRWGTFAGYRTPRPQGRRIDWILVSPDCRVDRAGINAQRCDGGWASDHLPVQALLSLPGTAGTA